MKKIDIQTIKNEELLDHYRIAANNLKIDKAMYVVAIAGILYFSLPIACGILIWAIINLPIAVRVEKNRSLFEAEIMNRIKEGKLR